MGSPRGAGAISGGSVEISGGDFRVAALFKPDLEAVVVLIGLGRLLAAVCRDVEEDVFDCRIGEDEAEE